MAADGQLQRKSSCHEYPDFAATCFFIEKFGDALGLLPLNVKNLRDGFEASSGDVPALISELHIFLLRRIKRNVPIDKWERELAKFCHSYNQWHAWEVEESGYAKLKLSTRLAIIRNLLEAQFDANLKFQDYLKSEAVTEDDLRKQCYGRDKDGLCYWLIQDEDLVVTIYRIEQDDTDGTSWQVIVENRDELATLIECLKESKPIPSVKAVESLRCDTPLSHVSSATGAFANATPTKFALDRSTAGTPVKSQLALTPNVSSASLTVKSEASDDKPNTELETKGEEQVKPAVENQQELKPAEETEQEVKPAAESEHEVKPAVETEQEGKPAAEIEQVKSVINENIETAEQVKPAEAESEIKDETVDTEITADVKVEPVTETDAAIEPETSEEKSADSKPEDIADTPNETEQENLQQSTEQSMDTSEDVTDSPKERDIVQSAPTEDKSAEVTDMDTSELMAQSKAETITAAPAQASQSNKENNENIANQPNTAAAVQSSSDSEDNIPLSQLKQTCILLTKARKSLLKAKKKHEKKKYKEMTKKQKDKNKAKLAKVTGRDSPKTSQIRASCRPKRPLVSENLAASSPDDSSDVLSDDDYAPKQGRNARRQAKRKQPFVVHHPDEQLSSEVDNDDTPCSGCGKYDQPHLILLCDKCDGGWHTACVKPPLFYIPDGEWHCPNCEQAIMLEKLEAHLEKLDSDIKALEAKKKRQERQEKYALSNGISLDNIITCEDEPKAKAERKRVEKKYDGFDYDSYEEDHGYNTNRSRRKRAKISYRFEEYEKMISTAIKDRNEDSTIIPGTNSALLTKPAPARSRGKDISNLIGEAGADLPQSSDEEENKGSEEEEEGEDEEHSGKGGKENKTKTKTAAAIKQPKPTPKQPAARRKPKSYTDMDADSAGEYDEDYNLSDDQQTDEAQTEVSDNSHSDDIWMPAGQKAARGRRRRGNTDNIKSFICDDDDEEDSDDGRRRRRKPPAARRQTRTSALATQASLRKKTKQFGFSSSDESLATTPCSSSTEEEEVQNRRKNRWNNAKTSASKFQHVMHRKTYSGGRSSKEPPKKASPKKKKKKRKRLADYDSDASTEQSTETEDEYVPPGGAEGEADQGSGDQGEESEEDGKEEGIRRVNNRLESSTDEETDEQKSRTDSKTPDSAKAGSERAEATEKTEATESTEGKPETVNPKSPQTGDTEAKSSDVTVDHSKEQQGSTSAKSKETIDSKTMVVDDSSRLQSAEIHKQCTEEANQTTDNNRLPATAQQPATEVVNWSSTKVADMNKPKEIPSIPSPRDQHSSSDSKKGTATAYIPQTNNTDNIVNSVKQVGETSNPKAVLLTNNPQVTPMTQAPNHQGQHPMQQGYMPNMPIRPQAFRPTPGGPPMHMTGVRAPVPGLPMMRPMNGQSQFYNPQNQIPSQRGIWHPPVNATGGPLVNPMGGPVNPMGGPPLNTAGSPSAIRLGGPPQYPQYGHQPASVPVQHPIVTAPIPTQQPPQTSNAFMVDSLLHTETTGAPSKTVGGFDAPVLTSEVTAEVAEEDDEMSSYMAMANSLVTGK